MANASFTRDEVILALDVLYSSGDTCPSRNSDAISELCALLQELPIHPLEGRLSNFRNNVGVHDLIYDHWSSKKRGVNTNIGSIWGEVDRDFHDDSLLLHRIAEAIRRNKNYFRNYTFGATVEAYEFPEGSLLGHLHRLIEARDSAKLTPGTRCEICQIDTADIYPGCPSLMRMHLTVPITELDGKRRYKEADFITVCPNCHAALHRRRPWLTKENCGDLLR